MGAALCPHIANEGWAGFRETKKRERGREERMRVQRLSQTSHSTGGGEGGEVKRRVRSNLSHLLFVCPELGRK